MLDVLLANLSVRQQQPMADITMSEKKSCQLRERSSSSKNITSGRELRAAEYLGSTSKMNDSMGLTSKASREYNKMDYDLSSQKMISKNLNENNDYIKSLYKKYLGKENQNHSDRKMRTDSKIQKNLFKAEETRDPPKLQPKNQPIHTPHLIKSNTTQESHHKENPKRDSEDVSHGLSRQTLTKNRSSASIELTQKKPRKQESKPSCDFYQSMMNQQTLSLLGNPRSSLVRCMQNICRARQSVLLK